MFFWWVGTCGLLHWWSGPRHNGDISLWLDLEASRQGFAATCLSVDPVVGVCHDFLDGAVLQELRGWHWHGLCGGHLRMGVGALLIVVVVRAVRAVLVVLSAAAGAIVCGWCSGCDGMIGASGVVGGLVVLA